MSEEEDRARKIEGLLGSGRFVGPARQRALDRVMADPRLRSRRRRVFWLGGAAGSVLAAAAALVLWIRAAPDDFRARGGGAQPFLRVACRDGAAERRCPAGGTLVFEVHDAVEGGVLQAYARRVGAADDERIWYFPGGDRAAPQMAAQAGRQLVPRGIRLGAEQPPGEYEVHLVLSRRPLAREELAAPPTDQVLSAATVVIQVAGP